MFSVIFPGQGSQSVGMAKDLYNKFDIVKKLFEEADSALGFSITNLILDGTKEELDQTENTQPAIFLVGFSIFQIIKKEFSLDLNCLIFFTKVGTILLVIFFTFSNPSFPSTKIFSTSSVSMSLIALFKTFPSS